MPDPGLPPGELPIMVCRKVATQVMRPSVHQFDRPAPPMRIMGRAYPISGIDSSFCVPVSISGIPVTICLDLIVNLAKQAWQVVKDGKAVVNEEIDYATALPCSGIDQKTGKCTSSVSPQMMNSWKRKSWGPFKVVINGITNGKLGSLFKCDLFAFWEYNGVFNKTDDGKQLGGLFVDTATVSAHNVDATYGSVVNITTDKVSVKNIGTQDKPIASLAMFVTISVKYFTGPKTWKCVFEVNGDGTSNTYSCDAEACPVSMNTRFARVRMCQPCIPRPQFCYY